MLVIVSRLKQGQPETCLERGFPSAHWNLGVILSWEAAFVPSGGGVVLICLTLRWWPGGPPWRRARPKAREAGVSPGGGIPLASLALPWWRRPGGTPWWGRPRERGRKTSARWLKRIVGCYVLLLVCRLSFVRKCCFLERTNKNQITTWRELLFATALWENDIINSCLHRYKSRGDNP